MAMLLFKVLLKVFPWLGGVAVALWVIQKVTGRPSSKDNEP
jgi:hypothetical protein